MPEILNTLAIGLPPTGRPVPREGATIEGPTKQDSQPGAGSAAPVARVAQAVAPLPPSEILDPSVEDPDAGLYPLNHARILYASALSGAVAVATGGTGAANVLNAATYSRWSFTGSQSITLSLPANQMIDAVGLAAHSFGAAVVQAYYSATDAGVFVPVGAAQSGPEAMLFLLNSAVSAKRIRVVITATGPQVLGVIYAGVALQMQRPIYRGHAPATMSRVTEYLSNESEAGQWLGRNVIRQGLIVDLNWSRLSAAWVRQYFDPFIKSARTTPFFVAWNPQDYPREVAYAWTTEDIKPTNTGPRDLMSASLSAKGAA